MNGKGKALGLGVLLGAGIVGAGIVLAGCAGSAPAATPTSTPTVTTSATPTVAVSPSSSASPTSPATAAPASPSAEPVDVEMSGDQAIEVCLRLHDEYASAGESMVPSGAAQVYERTVEPHWLVLIPADNSYGPGYIECVLGGPYANPVHTGVGEMVSSVVTDEYIEHRRTVNDGL